MIYDNNDNEIFFINNIKYTYCLSVNEKGDLMYGNQMKIKSLHC